MASTNTILGFIAGASIGAIAGILLAPEKGSDMRKKIADSSCDLTDSIKQSFTDFVKGAKESAVTNEDTGGNVPKMNINTMG